VADDEKLSIDITAKDSASKVVDGLQKKVDQLEGSDVEVELGADASGADHTVESFADQLNKLTDTDKVVVLALRAGQAQAELAELAVDLATIDANDPDIAVKFDRYAEVTGQLDHLEGQIVDLGKNGDVNVGKVNDRIESIGEGAGKAGDAVHSMAGNAIGDFAATATGIGPLGEALGQLSETALGAEGSIAQIATAGAGMAGLAATMYVVQKTMKAIADTKAFHTAEIDAWRKSIEEGAEAAGSLKDRLIEADRVMAAPSFTNASNFLGLSDAVRDVTAQLDKAGLTVEQYTELVAGSRDDVLAWAQAQADAGMSGGLLASTLDIITQAQKDLAAANEASEVSSRFFTDAQAAQNAEADRWTGIAAAYASTAEAAAKRQKHLADESDSATGALQRQTAQLNILKGEIDDDQAWINLETQFDNVRQAGDDAIAAQVEANKTRGKTAKDAQADQEAAETAMRNFETATNDAKLAVIDYGTRVLGLPPKKVVDIITDLDSKGIDDAERQLAELKRQAEIRVKFLVSSPSGFYLGGTQGTTATAAAAPMVVTNNYLARADTPRQLARAGSRWSRVNGR
jgi:hypothetical protein